MPSLALRHVWRRPLSVAELLPYGEPWAAV